MKSKSLTEISNQYGSDKGTEGPSPEWPGHYYTDVYEAYLSSLRQAHINLLEIGLGVVGDKWATQIVRGRNTGGASLKMWHDYFPNANIFGIDINAAPYLDNNRTKTFVVDQGSVDDIERFLQSIGNIRFDVIVDDGSHRPDHQQISLSILFKRLTKGGLYFIEDLMDNGLGDGAAGIQSCDSVHNTRKLLKHFGKSGEFLAPNALVAPDYLKSNIEHVNFHVLQHRIDVEHRGFFGRDVRTSLRYVADSEAMCVIKSSSE